MLIATNPNQLGDKSLDPIENLAKMKENNLAKAAKYKLPNQADIEDPERSGGPMMAYQELLYRLWKCNPAIIVKDGLKASVPVYSPSSKDDGTFATSTAYLEHVALYAEVLSPDGWELKYLGGFPKYLIPEYSHVTLDERGVAKREIRGWRSVLIALIENRVITYRQAVRYFGEAVGKRSWRWHMALRDYKS